MLEEFYKKEVVKSKTGGAGGANNMTDLVGNLINVLELLTPVSEPETVSESDITSLIDKLIGVLYAFNNKQSATGSPAGLPINKNQQNSLVNFIISNNELHKEIRDRVDELEAKIKPSKKN